MIGHLTARAELERKLPRVTLLTGPPSIGKRTLAQHLLAVHQVHPADQSHLDHPSIEATRRLNHWTLSAPNGPYKVAVIRLDESSEMAQNALLKLLEEPPPTLRVILTGPPDDILPTVVSRCETYKLGPLSEDELVEVLATIGYPRVRARKAARLARGSVRTAKLIDDAGSEAWSTVVAVMRAISLGDRDGFHKAFLTWDLATTRLLSTWFTEAVSGQYAVFGAEETFGLEHQRETLLHMITSLSRVGNANPRLAARAALEPFLGV